MSPVKGTPQVRLQNADSFQAFCYLPPTTHYSVPVCLRFRPRHLLCVSLVRTKFDLSGADMCCTKEPLPHCLVIIFHEISIAALCVCVSVCLCLCVCVCVMCVYECATVCLFLSESFQLVFLTSPPWDDSKHSSHMTGALYFLQLSGAVFFFRTLALPHPFSSHYKGE